MACWGECKWKQHRQITFLHSVHAVSFLLLIDSGSEILNMASGDLDCKSLCEKEEDTRSASGMIKITGKLLKYSNIVSIPKQ